MKEDPGLQALFMPQNCCQRVEIMRDCFMCLITFLPLCQWCQQCQVNILDLFHDDFFNHCSGEKHNISVVDPSLLDGVDQLEALKNGIKVRDNVHIHRDLALNVHVYRWVS